MEEDFGLNHNKGGHYGVKRSCSSQQCIHCLKQLSKRRILQHQSRCPVAKLSLPDGFKVEKLNGKTVYFCQCGYRGQRCRVLSHIEKCVKNKEAIASTNFMSSISQFEEYRQSGHFEPLPEAQLAPIVIASAQSVSMTIQEIEAEEDSNVKYFDPRIHPRFSQFRKPKDDAPIPTLQNRYKIFSISLLLRLTGSFLPSLKIWTGNRCKNVSTARFLTQLNSHSSIFKNQPRTLAHLREQLKDVATVAEDIISVISHDGLIHKLKEALENYRHTAVWHYAHVAQLVEKKKKRAPRAHWETRKMRKYIADVRYRNRKWGISLRPLTLLQMQQRCGYVKQLDQMYLMRYYMTRPMPKYHRKKHIEKKEKLMTQYAVHRIADAFTADFYVDYICFEMKVGSDDSFDGKSNINIFQSKKQHDEWKKKVTKQLPTTTVWLAVSRLYLQNRKALMKAIYDSCQDRFRCPMPKKSEEEVYSLVIKWYQFNFLIDSDDWGQLKKEIQDKQKHEEKIQRQIDQVLQPLRPILYETMIDEIAPEEQPQSQVELVIALPKPIVRQFQPKYKISNFTQQQILQRDSLIKLKKKPRGFDPGDFQKCSKIGCMEWLQGEIYDCVICNSAHHPQCWPKNDFCQVCKLMNDSNGYSTSLPLSVSKYLSIFPEEKPLFTHSVDPLYQQEEIAALKNIERHFYKQQYCVNNVFHQYFTIYPFYNQHLKRLHAQDQKILDQYAQSNKAFPVAVRKINTIKGFGLVARRPIKEGELVSTYAGNVMSLSQVSKYGEKKINAYTFQLIQGPNAMSDFVVYPRDYASPGYFMNHADGNKANVTTMVKVSKNGPIILMQAARIINYGQELLYSYNGGFSSYNTQDYE